jgi:RHS repeat-associated protein
MIQKPSLFIVCRSTATGDYGLVGSNGETVTYQYDGPLLMRSAWSGSVRRRGQPEYVYSSRGWLMDVYIDSAIGGTTPTRQYSYDAAGNRNPVANSTTLPSVDAQDRLLSAGTSATAGYVSYGYAPNGELTSKTVTQTGGGTQTTSYLYDGLGHLLQVTLPPTTSGGSATTISYVVDGEGRRVAKLVNGAVTQGFLYRNAINVAAVLNGAGSVVEQFVYGTRANVPDYLIHAGGDYRIVSDLVGSPRAIVNAATGVVVETMSYDEFGNETEALTAQAPSGYPQLPFGFAGGLYDAQTGLVHFGAREYDATVGRWTSKDASRFGGGINLYGYCGDDPVNCIDLTGNDPIGAAVGVGIGTAVGGGIGFVLGAGSGLLASAPTFGTAAPATVPGGGYLGAAAGAGIGAFVGGVLGDAIGSWINLEARSARPSGLPTGTVPIDQSGLDRETIHKIKQQTGQGPKDWTGVDPEGNVWVDDGTGRGVPVGHCDDF